MVTHLPTDPLTSSRGYPLTHSPINILIYSLIRLVIYSPTCPFIQMVTLLPAPLFTHSPTSPFTHSLRYPFSDRPAHSFVQVILCLLLKYLPSSHSLSLFTHSSLLSLNYSLSNTPDTHFCLYFVRKSNNSLTSKFDVGSDEQHVNCADSRVSVLLTHRNVACVRREVFSASLHLVLSALLRTFPWSSVVTRLP